MSEVAAKSNVEIVDLEDGRKVEFVGKKKLLKDYHIDEHGHFTHATFEFRNGRVVTFKPPHSLLGVLAGHGAIQKIGDETAGEEEIDDMVLAVEEIVERLQKGEWSTKRESGGMAGTSILLRALVKVSGRSVEEIKEYLKGKTPQEKIALRNTKTLKPVIEELEAEKISKGTKVDGEALLASLVA